MRILFAAAETSPPTYPSVSAIFGDGLSALGHETVGLFYDDSGPTDVSWPGHMLTVPRPRRRPLRRVATSLLHEWGALDAILGRGPRFDAIIVRDDPVMALQALRWRARHGPVIYQISHLQAEEVAAHARAGIYGGRLGNVTKAVGLRALRNWALARADHVLPMTPEMAAALHLPVSRFTVIGEGVRRDWTADMTGPEARSLHGLPLAAPMVIYAGTFNKVRHLGELVLAHAILLRTRPDALLVLAGSGREPEDEAELRGVAASHGIAGSVQFLGRVPHAHVAALFDGADVVVSSFPATPVLRCNSPTRFFEALHRGRAVVAGDLPEQSRAVEAAGCGIVVHHSAASIATATLRLLNNNTERSQMGARGRTWVLANRTYERIAADVDTVLRTLAR